jgi:ketosteroid isomerase-like protein
MHSFRRTAASHALLAEESVDEVASMLGHKDANVPELSMSGRLRTQARDHGHEGLRRWWQEVAEAFELRFEIERLIDVDDERVLSVQRTISRFRPHTGIPLDNRWASLCWVRDGKIARAVGYPRRGGHSKPPGCGSSAASARPRVSASATAGTE